MKNQILISILFMIMTFSVTTAQNKRTVKITKIDSSESFYFLKAKYKDGKNGKILIVSRKEDVLSDCLKIKCGKTYQLALQNYFSNDYISQLPAKKPGTLLLREDGYIIWNGKTELPYKSEDIKSLCYMK